LSARQSGSAAVLAAPAWLEAVEADDLPELRSLAAGMRRDLPSSTA
jgi:hypothetical protein